MTERPYRAGDHGGLEPREAAMLACPACGSPCGSGARRCSHCDVELAAVRCHECYALHFAGARYCARCGIELAPEPLLDASNRPCPRCAATLAAGAEAGVSECTRCGGLFVDHRTFAARVTEKETEASHTSAAHAPLHVAQPSAAAVRYLPCPLCHEVMNRANFGKRSGVIVDVCRQHGTWFDAGELTQILEWVASGAYAESRRTDAQRADEAARAASHAKGPPERSIPFEPRVSDGAPLGTLARIAARFFKLSE